MKKEDTDAAWSEVASCMGQSVHQCKEKWRNLRYSFLRSLKPHFDGTSKKRYYLHKEMEFLIPFMKTRYDGVALPQYDDDSDEETKNGEEIVVMEEPSLDYNTLESQPNETQPKRRKMMQKLKNLNECPRKMFLLGLLPEISGLSETQMKVFRRKVFTLIDDITENYESTTEENNLDDHSSRENTKNCNDREFVTTVKAEPVFN